MAAYKASIIRATAIELREKAFALYTTLLPVITAISTWTLNGLDPNLPPPYDVRLQVEAYENLLKEALKLKDWSGILNAQETDTLTYPPPPVFFDGGGVFDGGGAPEEP